MKLFHNCILVCLCFYCADIQGQTPSNIEEITDKYSEYFALNREAVYLHLNKTTVVPGENIWFAAYAHNPKFQGPSFATTNLHVNLYDSNGQLKEAKTVFLVNGQGNGFFKVDSLFSGEYIIEASTKYMENFREDLSFSQTFTILGENTDSSVPLKYDLQLLPEAGHLVDGILNTVGVKLIDNSGKGVFFTEGKVLNSKNEMVTTFKGNRFGLSKFRFVPVSDEKYHVVLTPINGNTISQAVPESFTYGISLTTNVSRPDNIIFSFRTNRKTFERNKEKTWHIVFHKDGILKAFGFVFPEESLEANIPVSKNSLAAGVNMVTVFDENFQPILERMVFNWQGMKRKSVQANFIRTDRDSLLIDLRSQDSLGQHSLSVSILPAGTKAYSPKNNIFSAFYIEPYIRGELEDGSYYFSEEVEQRRRDYDMDLLLLTQGWSKYSWQDVFNNTPKELFPREVGFTISGKINNWNEKKHDRVFVKSAQTGLFLNTNLHQEGFFELDSIFVLDKDEIGIGLLSEKNDKVSKTAGYMRILPGKHNKDLEHFKLVNPIEKKTETKLILPEGFLKNTVEIDSVVIKADMQERANEMDLPIGAKRISITEDEGLSFLYITDLIAFNGFDVKRTMNDVFIYARRNRNWKGPKQPAIYLNGSLLYDNFQLVYLLTREVESLVINKNSNGPRLANGGGGIIRIETKKEYSRNKSRKTSFMTTTSNGFASEKEFYAPKYTSYTSDFFDYYGVIDWFPNLYLDETTPTTIKILNTLKSEIMVYVEGMTSEGALISETINLGTR